MEVDFRVDEIRSWAASCPKFIRRTLKIVIRRPVHSPRMPSSWMILLNAEYVLLYCFLPVVTEACLLTRATSNGVPTIAPMNPAKMDIADFMMKLIG